jgi:hypothetical protein
LRTILDWSALNQKHSVILLSNQSQFLETWRFFAHHVFRYVAHFHQFHSSQGRCRQIESTTFAGTCLYSVSLPESVVFIAGDTFPRSCEVRISNIDSCQEFNEWKETRQYGSTEAFEWHGWK